MQNLAEQRARQHGMLYAAGMRPAGGGRVPMTATGTVTPFAEEALPQGNPTPFGNSIRETGAPGLHREVQELAIPSRAMQTPGWPEGERSYEAAKYREVLRNPRATPEELAIAQARLKESD